MNNSERGSGVTQTRGVTTAVKHLRQSVFAKIVNG